VPDATPTACEGGKLAMGCFFGLRGTYEFPDVTESGGVDAEAFPDCFKEYADLLDWYEGDQSGLLDPRPLLWRSILRPRSQ
jgi:hypothetical protein